MARRPPAALRRPIPPEYLRYRRVPVLSGLPASAARHIAELERRWGWPGDVAKAFASWRKYVHGPARRLTGPVEQPYPCCEERAFMDRETLERALRELPAPAARALRQLLAPMDDRLIARTIHDPDSPATLPWWERRC